LVVQPNYSLVVGGVAPKAPAAQAQAFAGALVCSTIAEALDATTCARIVHAVTASFEAAGRDYPPSYRDNDRAVVDDPELARALFQRLRAALPARVIDRHGGAWRLVGLNDRFRFCRYTNGQCFRVHRDGAHVDTTGRRSQLTLQIYLDEEFEGGHTRFYASRRGPVIGAIEARTGRAVVFDHDLWHDGEAVTRGTKHVLRTDVLYAPERATVAEARDGLRVLEGHTGYVFSLLATRDGGLMSGSRDRTVRRWSRAHDAHDARDAWRCTHVLQGHTASVLALAQPRPGVVWSGSRDRTIREWDLTGGTSRVVASLGGAVLCLETIGEDSVAAGTADAKIVLFTSERERVLAGHRGWVWSLASLGDGLLVSGSEDGTIRLWDLASGECLTAVAPDRGPVHALAATGDGGFAAGFADGHVVIYAVDRERRTLGPVAVHEAHQGEIYALCPMGSGRLATAGEDDQAHVVRRSDGARVASLSHHGFVRSLARLDDGALVTGSYDAQIRVWSAQDAGT